MKTSLYMALLAMTATVSISAHAIPPVPPSPSKSVESLVTCKDFNELSDEEMQDLEDKTLNIVSFDEESREVCFK